MLLRAPTQRHQHRKNVKIEQTKWTKWSENQHRNFWKRSNGKHIFPSKFHSFFIISNFIMLWIIDQLNYFRKELITLCKIYRKLVLNCYNPNNKTQSSNINTVISRSHATIEVNNIFFLHSHYQNKKTKSAFFLSLNGIIIHPSVFTGH